MPNWADSMQQTFEFYVVDPGTWKDTKRLDTVKSCTITRDLDTDTLGSATFDITESVGECYIRVYLITIQNGVREKHALGTFLVQTPATSFDGKVRSVSMDAYTPLIELKENSPEIGYSIPKTVYYMVAKQGDGSYDKYVTDAGEYVTTDVNITATPLLDEQGNQIKTPVGEPVYSYETDAGIRAYYCFSETVMDIAYRIVLDKARAPKVRTECNTPVYSNFIADPNDTWFSFLNDLISSANYSFELDEMGRILFAQGVEFAKMQPVWTYTDDNSSILYPDIDIDHDIFGIPNVVEVTYSNGAQFRVENNDPHSPVSIPNRGREIIYRTSDTDLVGTPRSEDDPITEIYAINLLHQLSSVEYTLKYTHAYCPVRLGDCVRLNYSRAGLNNVKAKVIYQSIKCEPGCPVTETAAYTVDLWKKEVVKDGKTE